ncbi:MAG: HAD-IIIA family hydrolase [Planctomycetaceae bacterium]
MTQPSASQVLNSSVEGSSFDSVSAVVFDAVGTLMFPQPSVADTYAAAIRRHCGIDVAAEQVKTAVRTALESRSLGDALRTDEATERQFWADLIHTLCPQSDGFQNCFDDLFAHFEDARNWCCFPDVEPAVREIFAAGVPVAIASNFDRRLNSVCQGLPVLRDVPVRVISSEVGWRKPSPEFFQAVADRLQISADRILVVGDDLHNDVRGALAAGMQAAWICRGGTDRSVPEVADRAAVLGSLAELPSLLFGGRLPKSPAAD